MRIGKYVIGFAGSEQVKRFYERNRAVEGFALVVAIDGRSLLGRSSSRLSHAVEHQLAMLAQFASARPGGMPCGYDGFLQSAALVKGDAG